MFYCKNAKRARKDDALSVEKAVTFSCSGNNNRYINWPATLLPATGQNHKDISQGLSAFRILLLAIST